ncbi:MAG: hypothetical protein EXQ50_10840 [Acidobacteria bacterium]|nr:hypothetical protein [Acidobacteriota bacterium]
MKLIITIDTEGDNQWDAGLPRSTDNIRFIPRFQELCDRYHFPPTYLCTYEVVDSTAFDEILLPLHKSRRAEVGAHLHPWTNPPLSKWDRGDNGAAYPSELPADLFTQKLESLTALLAAKLGETPRSYRAGRWGLSAAHIPALLQCGYIVDCSVTPLLSWTDPGARERGQDFSDAPVSPYFVAWGDPAREGASGLLEVPVTILHTNAIMRHSPLLRGAYRRYRKTLAARMLNRAFWIAPQWFRPFSDMSVARLTAVYETARRLGLPAVEMMFHSSELMPDGSPHNLTVESVDHLFTRLDRLFAHLAGRKVEGITLSAFAEPLCKARGTCDR